MLVSSAFETEVKYFLTDFKVLWAYPSGEILRVTSLTSGKSWTQETIPLSDIPVFENLVRPSVDRMVTLDKHLRMV